MTASVATPSCGATGLEVWEPLPAPSGHFGPVQDISWEPQGGRFLVSVSSDQTARLLAPWRREVGGEETDMKVSLIYTDLC